MTLEDVRKLLECDVLTGGELPGTAVEEGFAADLMSEVLAYCRPRAVLLTGLATIQSVHTADVSDLAAVVFVHGRKPLAEVVALAARRGIPLLSTPRSMFEACGALHAAGIRPARKG